MSSLRKTKKLRQCLEEALTQLTAAVGNGARCEVPSAEEFRTIVGRFEKKAARVTVRFKRTFSLGKPMSPERRLRTVRRLLKVTHQVSGKLHVLLGDLRTASNGNPHAGEPNKGKLRTMAKFAITSLEPTLLALKEVVERAEEQRERFERLHQR